MDDLIENADTNITFEFGLRKRVDRTQVNFDLERAIYPSGSGFISEINTARFWMERKFSQRLTGTVGARYERTKTVDEVSTVNDRTYVRLDLGIKWALTERWFLTAGYELTDQEFRRSAAGKGFATTIGTGSASCLTVAPGLAQPDIINNTLIISKALFIFVSTINRGIMK